VKPLAALPLSALLLLTAPAGAQGSLPVSAASALAANQLHDGRLLDAGWRLAAGNAPFCASTSLQIGLLLQDVMLFDQPALARRTLGMAGDFTIAAVAQDSPAALGALVPSQEVVAVGNQALAALPAGQPGDFRRLGKVEALMESTLAKHGTVDLTLREADGSLSQRSIAGVRACRGRFELRNSGARAEADGERILIGRDFAAHLPAADWLSDAEFAGIVAHEFAHVILAHGAWLDRAGRDDAEIRRTEREADRLAIWLLANAGYDPVPFAQLLGDWGRRGRNGPPRSPTHDEWAARAAQARTEVAAMRAALLARGVADWSRDFHRE